MNVKEPAAVSTADALLMLLAAAAPTVSGCCQWQVTAALQVRTLAMTMLPGSGTTGAACLPTTLMTACTQQQDSIMGKRSAHAADSASLSSTHVWSENRLLLPAGQCSCLLSGHGLGSNSAVVVDMAVSVGLISACSWDAQATSSTASISTKETRPWAISPKAQCCCRNRPCPNLPQKAANRR